MAKKKKIKKYTGKKTLRARKRLTGKKKARRRRNPRRKTIKIPKWISKNLGKVIKFQYRHINDPQIFKARISSINRGAATVYMRGKNFGSRIRVEDIRQV